MEVFSSRTSNTQRYLKSKSDISIKCFVLLGLIPGNSRIFSKNFIVSNDKIHIDYS